MGANIGSTAIADVKLGNTQVDKIYLGNTEIWSKPASGIRALKFTSSGAQTLGVDTSVLGTVQPNFEYSTDGGMTWTTWDVTTTIPFGNGTDLYLRGSNTQLGGSSNSEHTKFVFSTSSQVDCSGNIMHLLDYTQDLTSFPAGSERNFQQLFRNCTALISAPELPATTLTPNCYRYMFGGCINITSASSLPATALEGYCYYGMFQNCSSLAACPDLQATTLAQYCYGLMFGGCTSITTPPVLPATALAANCYYGMFDGCISLATPPALPATTLAPECYTNMFYGCTSLVSSPALPATTLAQTCYGSMFSGCSNLESVPELPATILVSSCYNRMFRNCTKVRISASQTGAYTNAYTFGATPDSTYAVDMFQGTGGTFTGTPTQQTYYTSNTIIS